MPGTQIGRRKRWAPGPSAKIDWSHPLAQGLNILGLPNGLNTPTPTVSCPTSSTVFGPSWDVSAGIVQHTCPPSPHLTGLTMAGCGVWDSGELHMLTSDGGAGINGSAGGFRWWQFRISSGNVQAIVFGTSPVGTTVSGVITAGIPFRAVASIQADKSVAVWAVCGSLSGYAASGANGTAAYSGPGNVLCETGRFGATVGSVSEVAQWLRPLSEAEAQMWLADPFCMLRF